MMVYPNNWLFSQAQLGYSIASKIFAHIDGNDVFVEMLKIFVDIRNIPSIYCRASRIDGVRCFCSSINCPIFTNERFKEIILAKKDVSTSESETDSTLTLFLIAIKLLIRCRTLDGLRTLRFCSGGMSLLCTESYSSSFPGDNDCDWIDLVSLNWSDSCPSNVASFNELVGVELPDEFGLLYKW